MPFDHIAQIVPERGQQIRQSELKPEVAARITRCVPTLGEASPRWKPLGEYVNGRFIAAS
jgi:hypothetical protein